jgi:hypothetical protein
MKGVVVEIRHGQAAVLTRKGTILTTRKPCQVGDVVTVHFNPFTYVFAGKVHRRRALAFAAVLIAAVFLSFHYYAWNVEAASYVTAGEDGSIEYTLNRRNEVIAITALTEEAEEAVAQLEEAGLQGLPISQALDQTASILDWDQESVPVSYTCAHPEDAAQLEEQLMESDLAQQQRLSVSQTPAAPEENAPGEMMPDGQGLEQEQIQDDTAPQEPPVEPQGSQVPEAPGEGGQEQDPGRGLQP